MHIKIIFGLLSLCAGIFALYALSTAGKEALEQSPLIGCSLFMGGMALLLAGFDLLIDTIPNGKDQTKPV